MEKPILKNELEVKIEGVQKITDNMNEFKQYALDMKEFYSTLTFNDEQLKEAKTERASVNKIVKKVADYRKEIVNKFNEPLENFVNTAKEVEALLKDASNCIDVQVKKYEEEAKYYESIDKECMSKILNPDLILQEIKDELLYFKKTYGFPRKSRVISQSEILDIPQGTFNVVITENSYIKKLPANENIGAYKGDKPVHVIRIENTSEIIFMTAQGRGFKYPVHKIPITEKNSLGIDIRILIKGISSNVVTMFDADKLKSLSNLRQKHYAVIVTKKNYIKKIDINDVLISTPSGVIMTKLNPGDEVKDVIIANNKADVVIYSKKKALRCKMESVPNYKRNTLGVFAMKTTDEIDGVSIIDPKSTDIVVITESGRINKFDISGLPLADRYTAGNRVIKLGKTDSIVSIFSATDNNSIKVITKNTVLDIPVKDISRTSSISPGTKMIPLKGDVIVKCVLE